MKRIALLLAGAVLGTGCVVDTCDTPQLSIVWDPVDTAYGITNCTIGEFGGSTLTTDVNYMHVYVDDVLFDTLYCDDYGVTYTEMDLSPGSHLVTFEGTVTSSPSATVVIRDVRSVHFDSCGVSYLDAFVGETYVDLNASFCNSSGSPPTMLWYSLDDTTWPTVRYLATDIGVTCGAGSEITYGPVPYGYYTVVNAEEFNSAASPAYLGYSNCSQEFAFFYEDAASQILPMVSQAACL